MLEWLTGLQSKIDARKQREIIYLIPLMLLCLFCFYQSLTFMIHDYNVSYFPARMLAEGLAPEALVFDIYEFNDYIWSQGYPNEISDYYLNSPFLTSMFYPLALISDPYLSKAVFNALSIVLFLIALRSLVRRYLREHAFILIFLPVIFFFPIRNHILFGQLYMLIFALVSFGFLAFEKHRNILGGGLISIAILSKIFPVFYLLVLAFQRNWKAIFVTAGMGSVILLLSWWVSGTNFWFQYLFDVLPDALASESTTGFRSNAQSLDVFFRTLLVQDSYYNPGALMHNPSLYKVIVGLLKSVILAFTLCASYRYRDALFKLLAIWVAALFLLQTRTGSYAQILWIIPLIEVYRSPVSLAKRLVFLGVLLIICNFPFPVLINAPVMITFMRLWFSILLVALFWKYLNLRMNLRFMGLGLLLMMPLALKSAFSNASTEDGASYVLEREAYFMIHDFEEVNGALVYQAIGNGGNVTVSTTIPIRSFEPEACRIVNGQVFYKDEQLTTGLSLKKKPVLVNECEVYYLSDQLSRRGAFTLKKIDVCN